MCTQECFCVFIGAINLRTSILAGKAQSDCLSGFGYAIEGLSPGHSII